MASGNERRAFEITPDGARPVGPGRASTFDVRIIDFGHYAGRSIAELANEDPDYLRWLARHPSGCAIGPRSPASLIPRFPSPATGSGSARSR
jgi:hypothetical protein